MPLMTREDLVKLTGKTFRTVTKRLEEAGIDLDSAGKVDSKVALPALYKPDYVVAGAESDLQPRDRLALAQALKVEKENAIRDGELMEVVAGKRQLGQILTNVRARMLAIPAALASHLVGITDAAVAESRLRKAIYDACRELASRSGQSVPSGTGDPGTAAGSDDFGVGGPLPTA